MRLLEVLPVPDPLAHEVDQARHVGALEDPRPSEEGQSVRRDRAERESAAHLVGLLPRVRHELHKLLDPPPLRDRHRHGPPPLREPDADAPRALLVVRRALDHVALRLVADAAPRGVEHAEERGGVGRVRDELQVREEVLDPGGCGVRRGVRGRVSRAAAANEEGGVGATHSVRSKNLCPPTMRLGTPAFCSATSTLRDKAPYLSRTAKSLKPTSPPKCATRCRIVEAMKVASSGAEGAGCRTTDEPVGCEVVSDLGMRLVSGCDFQVSARGERGKRKQQQRTLSHDGERRAQDGARRAVVLLEEDLLDRVELCAGAKHGVGQAGCVWFGSQPRMGAAERDGGGRTTHP